jgi:RNA polymerase sigma-70 factor (ECF subfamily)
METGARYPDDAQWVSLMAAAQNGDQQCYARLLRGVTPLLRHMARQEWRMASDADIEDVVQETLLTLHAVRHTYDPRRPFLPWLLTLLHRRVVDAVRRRSRTYKREIAVDALDVTFPHIPTNNEQELPVDGEALRKAIALLPASQRQAIELLKQKEIPLKVVSAMTGMSVTALKVATHRAMKALRVLLAVRK